MERDQDRVHSYALAHGVLADRSATPYPTRLQAWRERHLDLESEATHFGFVCEGGAELTVEAGRFLLGPGMYFSVPGGGTIGAGAGIVLSRLATRGFFQIGGPVETRGRLRYIDGCTDSLLIPPVLRGDACLNLLHLPPGTDQTRHTHPSLRAGVIVSGRGKCVTPSGVVPLEPGVIFEIPAGSPHAFRTAGEALRIIAYHPDSDFGPTHEHHPMLNRTIVDGKPCGARAERQEA